MDRAFDRLVCELVFRQVEKLFEDRVEDHDRQYFFQLKAAFKNVAPEIVTQLIEEHVDPIVRNTLADNRIDVQHELESIVPVPDIKFTPNKIKQLDSACRVLVVHNYPTLDLFDLSEFNSNGVRVPTYRECVRRKVTGLRNSVLQGLSRTRWGNAVDDIARTLRGI